MSSINGDESLASSSFLDVDPFYIHVPLSDYDWSQHEDMCEDTTESVDTWDRDPVMSLADRLLQQLELDYHSTLAAKQIGKTLIEQEQDNIQAHTDYDDRNEPDDTEGEDAAEGRRNICNWDIDVEAIRRVMKNISMKHEQDSCVHRTNNTDTTLSDLSNSS